MTDNETPRTTPLTLMGVMLILLGVLAMATPAVAGKTVVMVIGIVMLLAGVIQIVSGFRSEGRSGRIGPIILGALALLCGIGLLSEPIFGMVYITLLLAIFFAVEGVWKIITAFSYRPATGWLAVLASGFLTLILGLLIWNEWPISGLWAIGVLVGINLLMTGVSLVAVASTLRGLKRLAQEQVQAPADEPPAS
jgi:uncharacterized membrane protein HdeD (DUF308 family)